MYKITEIIDKTCKDLKICYNSPNHHLLKNYKKDVRTLADIYLRLKIIVGELEEFREKYPELKEELSIDIYDINKAEHHLILGAKKILLKNKELK